MKIYLAGPDVFLRNSVEVGELHKQECEKFGYEGLYPLDNIIETKGLTKKEIAKNIFEANRKMIKSADVVVADLNAFRGKEIDSGTSWEIGYAVALGITVIGYMESTKSYKDRFDLNEVKIGVDAMYDSESREIEDFDLPVNLMLACSMYDIVSGNIKNALELIPNMGR